MAIDFVATALSRLTNQFENSPKLRGLVEAFVKQFDQAMADADALKSLRWISTAEGEQLDGCGYIVREPRNGRSDEEYRDAILFRVFVNTSNGTPGDLIRGLRTLTKPDDIQYIEQYPATAMLFTDGPNVPEGLQALMQDLAPATISQVPIMVSFARAKPLRFGSAVPDSYLNVGPDTRLTANGNRLKVSSSAEQEDGATLGGLACPNLAVTGGRLTVGGLRLALTSPNHMVPIESGYHLTGLFSNLL